MASGARFSPLLELCGDVSIFLLPPGYSRGKTGEKTCFAVELFGPEHHVEVVLVFFLRHQTLLIDGDREPGTYYETAVFELEDLIAPAENLISCLFL